MTKKTTSLADKLPEQPKKKRRTGDEIWEDIMNSDYGKQVAEILAAEAEKDIAAGNFEDGGFGGD